MLRLFLMNFFLLTTVGTKSGESNQTINYLLFSTVEKIAPESEIRKVSGILDDSISRFAKFFKKSSKYDSSQKINCQDTGAPFTESERQIFVDKHNAYRSQLALGQSQFPDGSFASSAANMVKMTYNCDLEKIAQNWTNNCKFEHSPPPYRNAGENIYALYTGTNGNWRETIISEPSDVWWAELKKYGGITQTNVNLTWDVFSKGIGHWSQMAWAASTTIGCGWTECPQGNGMVMHLVVCNYRPAGNFLNENIYEIGNPCSNCNQLPNSQCEVNTGLCLT